MLTAPRHQVRRCSVGRGSVPAGASHRTNSLSLWRPTILRSSKSVSAPPPGRRNLLASLHAVAREQPSNRPKPGRSKWSQVIALSAWGKSDCESEASNAHPVDQAGPPTRLFRWSLSRRKFRILVSSSGLGRAEGEVEPKGNTRLTVRSSGPAQVSSQVFSGLS